MYKPMLACDWDPARVPFPVIAQPKIDGVRGVNLGSGMSARTLKPFGNKYTNLFFSQQVFKGFDGELAAESETHPRLCNLTGSATSTHEGQPWLMWHVFDLVTPETINLPYEERLLMSAEKIGYAKQHVPELGCHLTPIPWVIVKSMDELEGIIEQHIDQNFEGTILRKRDGRYKQGRCTAREGLLLRIKPFITVDAIVIEIHEGKSNQNEATTNALGHTERSTHQENMVPNGMVGAMTARLCEDAIFNGKVIHKAGDPVRFGAGRLAHEQRALYFVRQDLLVGKRIQGQIFPRGVKDKPRFPTFQAFRAPEDVV